MEGKGNRLANVCSLIYLVAALWLLGAVCGSCYPAIGESIRHVMAGEEDGSVREAFSVLADGLERGEPIQNVIAASVEVLVGEKA